MKKFFFCVSLVLTGLMTSCIDKNEEVDADAKPSWLGGSIYAELKNPKSGLLTGTFKTYLRLVDDLGYAETLNRTGSKTVFPANDEAFERFFKSNDWGVTTYEQLSDAQKKLLLYNSMLDNALLLNMLPNVSTGTADIMKGRAVKHATNVSVIDSVQFIANAQGMPKSNNYWTKYYDKGIHLVNDGTRPMMVHLTREYMLQNGISTTGEGSDFEVLTGVPYSEGTAYIFNDRVINSDVTCLNGYIQQMEDVLVPPGNMAQVVRANPKTKIYSRILDYFSAPFYDENITRNYNDWAVANGHQTIDSIFQMRYLSQRSNESTTTATVPLNRDPNRIPLSASNILGYDPGWNQYYPHVARAGNIDVTIMDMGAFFVPDDDAMKKYFLPGGTGSYLIDIYGDKPNTEENLIENIDSLHSKNPQVLASFTKNLMKASFAGTVPSKFATVTNDASENMGLSVSLLDRKENGKYDITMANNGAVYVLNTLLPPDEYQAVLAPASVYPDMKVMNWAIQDGVLTGDFLGVDFKYYLLAMSANYAFFIPEDGAFDLYYLDPTSLGHRANNNLNGKIQPIMLHFYYDAEAKSQPYLKCDRYNFNMETGQVEGVGQEAKISDVKTQLVDILNYHTIVLNNGETLGSNHYYKTKHGGEIYVEGSTEGSRIMGGLQLSNPDMFPAPQIKHIYTQKNGNTYRLSRVILPTTESVYSVLSNNEQFSEFLEICNGFSGATDIMNWAGIPEVNPKDKNMPSPQDAYMVFTRDYSKTVTEACLDYNVKMFNTFNYTLFAPDNEAMAEAYAAGLPHWTEIQELFEKYKELGEHEETAEETEDKALVYNKIRALRDFIRYHFTTNSVYADNNIDGGRYQTLCSDDLGVAKELTLSGGAGQLSVTDGKAGHTVTINAASTSKVVNKMTRDYWFNASKLRASSIETSSFCAVHQISDPLFGTESGRFDDAWGSRAAARKMVQTYKRLKANNEL